MPEAYTAIVNPAAGRGRAAKLLARLEGAIAAGGLDCEVRVSANAEEPVALAREAMARGRGVVACGGDGLVGQLAAVTAEAGGVLGIVPLGAGNDFARFLGLDPNRPLTALGVLREGIHPARTVLADAPSRRGGPSSLQIPHGGKTRRR